MDGKFIKKWRLRHGLTQAKAATWCKSKLDTWRKWETSINPIPDMLQFALDAFDNLSARDRKAFTEAPL